VSENLSCCYPFLGSHTKNKKYKKYIYNNNNNNNNYYYYYYYYYLEGIQKIIGVKKGCWNAHKMARNWLRRFENT
jgi:hypothetical protein